VEHAKIVIELEGSHGLAGWAKAEQAPCDAAGTASVPPAPPPSAGPGPDEAPWSFIKDTADQFRRFIREYPSSPHRREAEDRLRALEPPAVAMTLPARPAETAKPAGNPCGGVVAVSLASSRKAAPLSAAEECGLKPKDSFRECANCPEMVVLPAGSFTMGSPADEKDRRKEEGPQHVVTIGRPFAVGKFHVTRDQFAAFVRDTGYEASKTCADVLSGTTKGSWRDPGFAQDGSHPVVL
jgi:formylglycine-generating enzyme required for sulfatase activity